MGAAIGRLRRVYGKGGAPCDDCERATLTGNSPSGLQLVGDAQQVVQQVDLAERFVDR